MLDILVPHVVLDGAGIVALVCQKESTGMTEHVWMDREVDVGFQACTTDDLSDRGCS